MKSSYALVTGASSGIGLEIARVLARKGYSLILVARREAVLQKIASDLRVSHSINVEVVAADLSLPKAPEGLHERVKHLNIDILVNNAGFGELGRFARISLQTSVNMIQVNVTSLTALTRLFLPAMLEKKRGWIMNVASTAAFQPGPFLSVYYATKAYVLSFSEGLAEELRGTGVSITAVCPGPTVSEFHARASTEVALVRNRAVLMGAAKVAEQGVSAMFEGRVVYINGYLNRFLAGLSRVTPNRLVVRVLGKLQDPTTLPQSTTL